MDKCTLLGSDIARGCCKDGLHDADLPPTINEEENDGNAKMIKAGWAGGKRKDKPDGLEPKRHCIGFKTD